MDFLYDLGTGNRSLHFFKSIVEVPVLLLTALIMLLPHSQPYCKEGSKEMQIYIP